MTTLNENRLVVLNSRDGKKLNGTSNSNIVFTFPSLMIRDDNIIHNALTLDSVDIPHTFYNVTEHNNILRIRWQRAIIKNRTMTIPVGNYNTETFRVLFLAMFQNLFGATPILVFNPTTGKYNFNPPPDTNGNISIVTFLSSGSTGLRLLGVNETSDTTIQYDAEDNVELDYVVDFFGSKKLNVFSDALAGHNSDSSFLGETHIIASVSITSPFLDIIHFKYLHSGLSILKNKSISQIDIQIRDENNNLVNFNNHDWSFAFHILTYRKKEHHPIKQMSFLEDQSLYQEQPKITEQREDIKEEIEEEEEDDELDNLI